MWEELVASDGSREEEVAADCGKDAQDFGTRKDRLLIRGCRAQEMLAMGSLGKWEEMLDGELEKAPWAVAPGLWSLVESFDE